MPFKFTTYTIVLLLAVAACDRGSEPLTQEQRRAITETVMALAAQPPAYPGGDLSRMQATVVHPEVALVHGYMGIPDTVQEDSPRVYVTMVFTWEDDEWAMRQSWGVATQKTEGSGPRLIPLSPELKEYIDRLRQ